MLDLRQPEIEGELPLNDFQYIPFLKNAQVVSADKYIILVNFGCFFG